MKYINKSYINKQYEYSDGIVSLILEDTRDNYIEPDALGKIGNINISKGFLQKNINYSYELDEEREAALDEALVEIFGTAKLDGNSDEPYRIITRMIADGSLKTLGYEEFTLDYNLDDNLLESINRHHRR